MSEEYDWDVYDVFKEQLDIQLPHIEEHILALENEDFIDSSLDELFRFFHTYKATSAYLSLIPLHTLVCKVETVISSLKDSKKPIQDDIIEWLLQVKDQMILYSSLMEKRETLLPSLPQELLNKIKITPSYIKPIDKLKTLSIIYIDLNIQRAKKVVPFLKKYTPSVKFISDIKEIKKLDTDNYHIAIINLDKDNHKVIDYYKNNYPNLAIIAIFNKISNLCSKKLLENGISHAIQNPLNGKIIERELLSIVKVFHSSNNIMITHKKINDFIKTLQPLPNTILQIMQICDDEEISIKELIKVVKADPIISANILSVANSPIYGTNEIKTIDQAVVKFGKKAIKALATSGVHNSLGKIDISAYEITEDTFSQISLNRLSLMLKWYSKVSIADLSILTSTASLGNIGQLLISKELLRLDIDDKFIELCSAFDIKYAEESLLHTTTCQISSQILNYWKLSEDIVDVIEYSDYPKDAPKEIRKLCVANSIVNTLIDLQGNIAQEIPDEILPLLAEFNLDPKDLANALESIKVQ